MGILSPPSGHYLCNYLCSQVIMCQRLPLTPTSDPNLENLLKCTQNLPQKEKPHGLPFFTPSHASDLHHLACPS